MLASRPAAELPVVADLIGLLLKCKQQKDLPYAKQLYDHVRQHQLLESHGGLGNHLVPVLVECGGLDDAQHAFDRLPCRNLYSWTALISGYVHSGNPQRAFHLYHQMQEDHAQPNNYTYVVLLKACAKAKNAVLGQELHATIICCGLDQDPYIGNALVDMYCKQALHAEARQVFARLPSRDPVTWNALISGYAEHGLGEEALNCFQQMQSDKLPPGAVTYACSLKACGSLGAIKKGHILCAEVLKTGMEKEILVGNTLVDMYSKCCSLTEAHWVFDRLPVRDVVTWNILISGYAEHGFGEEALATFRKMQLEGVYPDDVTIPCSLKACAIVGALEIGQEIDTEIIKRGLEKDLLAVNALIDMYSKCGLLAEAQKVLDKLPVRDAVSWNALITGYIEHGLGEETLRGYEWMQLEGVFPDVGTLSCCLKACGIIGDLERGLELHAKANERGLERDHSVAGTMIDMYSKCGALAEAQKVLENLPSRGVSTWNSLITAYAEQGLTEKTMSCFGRMKLDGIAPNDVTFLCILKSCSSTGVLETGQVIHSNIVKIGLEREGFLGNTLVDMYAKCGSLVEVQNMFTKLPTRDTISWNTLMTAYAEHGLGKETLNCCKQMQMEGVPLISVTYTCCLKACGFMGSSKHGQEIHTEVTKRGLEGDLFVGNALVDMYSKSGMLADAQSVMFELPIRSALSWNALVGGFTDHGHGEEALRCLQQMQMDSLPPDMGTFPCSLRACCIVPAVEKGRELHADVVKRGFESDSFIGSTLVDMYAKFGFLTDAQDVFDQLPVQGIIAWNSLIAGGADHGLGGETMRWFKEMQLEGVPPVAATYVSCLKVCSSMKDIERGEDLHTVLVCKGLERDMFVGNTLIDMYGKCGLPSQAQEVFARLPVRDTISWSALIGAHVEQGAAKDALDCFEQMQLEAIPPAESTFLHYLKCCSIEGALETGQKAHTEIILRGLEKDVLIGSILVDMYGNCGSWLEAQETFDALPVQGIISWNALIAAYAENCLGKKAVKCFEQMQLNDVPPTDVTFVCALKACGSIEGGETGQLLCCEIIKRGFENCISIGSTLVDMYCKCSLLQEAHHMFTRLPVQGAVSWNALIAGYADHALGVEALRCFGQMELHGIPPDDVTFLYTLKACCSIKALEAGRDLYGKVIERGLEVDPFITSIVVDMFGKCGSIAEAWETFHKLPVQSTARWNTMIAAYIEHGLDEEALSCVKKMMLQNLAPDAAAYACSLKACSTVGALETGQVILTEVTKRGLEGEPLVGNTVVDIYMKCGDLVAGEAIFDKLPVRDAVSWTALISGYVEHGLGEEALTSYGQMQLLGVIPDDATFPCCLKACGIVGALETGRELHAELIYRGLDKDLFVGNTLVGMYSKSGSLAEGRDVFDKLPTKDVVSWTAMIKGYGENHEGKLAIRCFEEMQEQGVRPNAVIFTCLLAACSHVSMVLKGHEYFEMMREKHGIEPSSDHYACMIDLLARSGHVYHAERFAETMQCHLYKEVQRALLTACKIHGDVELGLICFQRLVLVNQEDAAAYLLMADIYKSVGRLSDARKVEETRNYTKAKKLPAIVSIEVNKERHEFVVGHTESVDTSSNLEFLSVSMRNGGYVPNLQLILKP